MSRDLVPASVDNPSIPQELPVVPLKDVVIFPRMAVPLLIVEPASAHALDTALRDDRIAAFVALRSEAGDGSPKPADCYSVGTAAKIVEIAKQPDGSVRLLVEGVVRVSLDSFMDADGYLRARVTKLPELEGKKTERVEAQMYSIVNQFKECVNLGATVPFDVLLVVMNITDPRQLADLITLNLDFRVEEKQAVLEAKTVEEKLTVLGNALGRTTKVLRLSRKIQSETGKELGKMEREMMLREQLKTIEKELGILGGVSETDVLRKKIEEAGMPEEVKQTAQKELARMQAMPSFSPEISYVRGYLDWLISLPWSKKSESKIDLKQAQKILDKDHYGLEKAKERVLEYLAVQKLVGKIKGPILCFVGPPGTGKTSIGKSIARSLGRKFVRMSLGGVRDEAEIRGFRRTYVGALPGRILQGISQAGTRNPVFMLDEIDKLGADAFRGDPSSALLEALDPEQNSAFSDHYLEVPFDLSDVMFITTANILDTIPPALRDRMEMIEFPGYTEDEKFNIAKNYLLPEQLTNHGCTPKQVKITDGALREIVRKYTREAGVRNLEREIATVCRKVARAIATGTKKSETVDASDLSAYLGPERFHSLEAEKRDEVGVATGLAWTEAGGEILVIEAAKMPGRGMLTMTGQLGKVMQESAQAAFSYARSRGPSMGFKGDFTKDLDIHIHVPSGAIPKDGPSAGISMATALLSLLANRPVRRDVAMTGEITLRGRAMEIGGVKEKVLAAHRAGIKTVILPKDNEKDIADVPANVRKELKFVFVDHMDDVVKIAFAGKKGRKK